MSKFVKLQDIDDRTRNVQIRVKVLGLNPRKGTNVDGSQDGYREAWFVISDGIKANYLKVRGEEIDKIPINKVIIVNIKRPEIGIS